MQVDTRFYTKLERRLWPLFASRFSFQDKLAITIMRLESPRPARAVSGVHFRALRPDEPLEPLLGLLEHYPDNFFQPSQVQHGLYVVGFEGTAPVVAAGTHVFAPEEHTAVIGNVVTDAGWRGQGLCQACVSRLCAGLRERGCRHIGLHVASANIPAIMCYRHAGFTEYAQVDQLLANRDDA